VGMSEKASMLTDSELALRTIAMPVFANAHGDIFGGWLLSQMDLAGSAVAIRRAKGRVVLRSPQYGHRNELSSTGICRR
jgi:acyl-CoA thioesterase YciA